MKKPTIYEIKRSGVLGEYFFSRDSLRFFGQTMSSFKVEWHDKAQGIVMVYAPIRDSFGNKMGYAQFLSMFQTQRFIDVNNWAEVKL